MAFFRPAASEGEVALLRLLAWPAAFLFALLVIWVGFQDWRERRALRAGAREACVATGRSDDECRRKVSARDEDCWDRNYTPGSKYVRSALNVGGYRVCVIDPPDAGSP